MRELGSGAWEDVVVAKPPPTPPSLAWSIHKHGHALAMCRVTAQTWGCSEGMVPTFRGLHILRGRTVRRLPGTSLALNPGSAACELYVLEQVAALCLSFHIGQRRRMNTAHASRAV